MTENNLLNTFSKSVIHTVDFKIERTPSNFVGLHEAIDSKNRSVYNYNCERGNLCREPSHKLDQGWPDFLDHGPNFRKKYCRGPQKNFNKKN
jgi:hypothetical protein